MTLILPRGKPGQIFRKGCLNETENLEPARDSKYTFGFRHRGCDGISSATRASWGREIGERKPDWNLVNPSHGPRLWDRTGPEILSVLGHLLSRRNGGRYHSRLRPCATQSWSRSMGTDRPAYVQFGIYGLPVQCCRSIDGNSENHPGHRNQEWQIQQYGYRSVL